MPPIFLGAVILQIIYPPKIGAVFKKSMPPKYEDAVLTVRLCIQETLNVCAWGTRYLHIHYQIFSTIGCGLLAELQVLVQQLKLNATSCSS